MSITFRRRFEGAIFFVLFCLTVPLANWMIQHVGTVCVPHGPCLVPVAPGLLAPSGVLTVAGVDRNVAASGTYDLCASSGAVAKIVVTGPGGSTQRTLTVP